MVDLGSGDGSREGAEPAHKPTGLRVTLSTRPGRPLRPPSGPGEPAAPRPRTGDGGRGDGPAGTLDGAMPAGQGGRRGRPWAPGP
jgi:hypothetical protein